MKLFLLLVATMIFFGTSLAQQSLPTQAQDFLKTHFSKDSVLSSEKDHDDIDVYLSNGSKLSFLLNGEWKEVNGKGKAIPTQFIPQNVLKSITTAYPKSQVVKIEKHLSTYEVKLDNNMELDINFNGKITKQELDN